MNGPMNDFNMNWSNFFILYMSDTLWTPLAPSHSVGPSPTRGGAKMPIPSIRLLLSYNQILIYPQFEKSA